jgi:hypothetical protein
MDDEEGETLLSCWADDEGDGDEESDEEPDAPRFARSLMPGRIADEEGVEQAGGGVVESDDENEFFECDDDESCCDR